MCIPLYAYASAAASAASAATAASASHKVQELTLYRGVRIKVLYFKIFSHIPHHVMRRKELNSIPFPFPFLFPYPTSLPSPSPSPVTSAHLYFTLYSFPVSASLFSILLLLHISFHNPSPALSILSSSSLIPLFSPSSFPPLPSPSLSLFSLPSSSTFPPLLPFLFSHPPLPIHFPLIATIFFYIPRLSLNLYLYHLLHLLSLPTTHP